MPSLTSESVTTRFSRREGDERRGEAGEADGKTGCTQPGGLAYENTFGSGLVSLEKTL